MPEKLLSLYVDCASWDAPVEVDDFLVAVGKTKSNSVYHIAQVKAKPRPDKRIVRYYLKVFKSDLITCLSRDIDQKLITITWYSRNKKK